MNKIFLFLVLILYINCQYWFDEVNGFNEGEDSNGYAGGAHNTYFADFYLCSERKYRVHYQGDDKELWSQEFTACQPAGNGKHIDGITISGGLPYNGRGKTSWFGRVSRYDIYDYDWGYSGNLREALTCIAIDGGDYYRSGYNTEIDSSNEFFVAQKVIKELFHVEKSILNYENETDINIMPKFNISVVLLNTSKINLEGKITIKLNLVEL